MSENISPSKRTIAYEDETVKMELTRIRQSISDTITLAKKLQIITS